MTPRKSRRKELEDQWNRERRKRGFARVSLVEVPADMIDMARLYRGLKRPKRLRAADLVQELARLALEWGDRRFQHCVHALFELGIIDKQKHSFSKKRGPHVYLKDKPLEDAEVAARVRTLTDRGLSERAACARIAVDLGWKATSPDAAFEQVRNALKRARKSVGKRARG